MKKTEFEAIVIEQENIIGKALQAKSDAEENYIEANKQFEEGDKIKVVTPPHPYWTLSDPGVEKTHPEKIEFAFVLGNKIDINNNVIPDLVKAKKDGTPSKIGYYYAPGYGVKKILTKV